jgi:hypothetical protein
MLSLLCALVALAASCVPAATVTVRNERTGAATIVKLPPRTITRGESLPRINASIAARQRAVIAG